METSIYNTLEKLGVTSKQSRVLFNNRTRVIDNLNVWKDSVSGVIYIDEFYTGNQTYIDGSYIDDEVFELKTGNPDFERERDAQRRFNSNLKFVAGKRVGDFGCGSGDFLRLAKPYCENVLGIELLQNYVDLLNSDGITCTNDLANVENKSLDILVSFHVIEHLLKKRNKHLKHIRHQKTQNEQTYHPFVCNHRYQINVISKLLQLKPSKLNGL